MAEVCQVLFETWPIDLGIDSMMAELIYKQEGEQKATPSRLEPGLIRVTERVFVAKGYSISNIIYVVTETGVVAIDTGESVLAARRSLEEFRKHCDLPITYIIYTHFHGDHIRGAQAICGEATRIIAHRSLPDELASVRLLLPYRTRVDSLQFGLTLERRQRAVSHGKSGRNGYIPPNILFDSEYRFEEGGVCFEVHHAPGESRDHAIVWLPEERIAFSADLFYDSFPMLSNPMKPDRPVQSWANSLDRIRALGPEHLVPSHGVPLSGTSEIAAALTNYAGAIRSVHDQTVDLINRGLTLEQIKRQVSLPAHLRELSYLQPKYGSIEWAVNGIFRQYTGWYDLNPAHLDPVSTDKLNQALIRAAGGVNPILRQVRKALNNGDDRLALDLTDIVLDARPRNRSALNLRTRALKSLASVSTNRVAQNLYRTAARSMERRLANQNEPQIAIPTPPAHPLRAFQQPVFILAAPRSFTSVVCAMLGQHPQMYGMPELHLFKSETMVEWFELCRREPFPRAHGMLRAVAQLFFGGQTEETIDAARQWLNARSHFTSGQLLMALAQKVHPAIVIEKSPSSSYEQESFARVCRMFPGARFIHLVRHPKGQGESVMNYMKIREQYGPIPSSHWLRNLAWNSQDSNNGSEPDPQFSWYALNQSLRGFLESVPEAQQRTIRGEDVLADPSQALLPILDWLGIRQDVEAIERMKHPEHSPYACIGPKGAEYGNDRLFLEKPELRVQRAKEQSLDGPVSWRTNGAGLVPEVIEFARQFGYQ